MTEDHAKRLVELLEKSMVKHGYVSCFQPDTDDDYEPIPGQFIVLVDGHIDLNKLEDEITEMLMAKVWFGVETT